MNTRPSTSRYLSSSATSRSCAIPVPAPIPRTSGLGPPTDLAPYTPRRPGARAARQCEVRSRLGKDRPVEVARSLVSGGASMALKLPFLVLGVLLLGLVAPRPGVAAEARGRVLAVGPGRELARPSDAAAVARDGDTVEIEAGDYAGDVAVWPQSGLTIRGVHGLARIDAAGNAAEKKAVWVVNGARVTVEGVELTGCRVDDHNGAGIRAEGRDLTLRGVVLHGNEMGILTSHGFRGELLIDRSEIYGNTVDYERYGALGHNIYVSDADLFTLRGSWIHGAVAGHNVKSRARETRILYNLIEDGTNGAASYQVDIPEGTPALILGNLLRQGPQPQNSALISFAGEKGKALSGASLYLVNNTAVSESPASVLLRNWGASTAELFNNALSGIGRPVEGRAREHGDREVTSAAFSAPADLDYRPRSGSELAAGSVMPSDAFGTRLVATYQYAHPHSLAPRPSSGPAADVGPFAAGG